MEGSILYNIGAVALPEVNHDEADTIINGWKNTRGPQARKCWL